MATKRRQDDGGECASKKGKEDRPECIVEKVIQSLGQESLRPEQKAVIICFHCFFSEWWLICEYFMWIAEILV